MDAEPLSCVMAAVWLFAAGMFPVGFMLGSSCSPCCGTAPCGLCTEGELPETLTVTLDNLPNQGQGPDLITLSFSSCFGSGATGRVTAPGGDPVTDKGAISAVSVTSGGSGYAKLGRVQPTITVGGGSGTGATFTPTLTNKQDACGVDYWEVSSIAASGGTGYVNGDDLTFSLANGDTQQTAAAADLFVGRDEPDLTLDTGNATATVTPSYSGGGLWGVDASLVTVTNGGSGYAEGDSIDFGYAADDVEVQAAIATANVVHDEPVATFSINTTGGSGAVLEAVWELLPSNEWPAAHKKSYRLTAVNVIDGGTGYGQYEEITISFASVDDGVVVLAAWADTDEPDGNGTIQSVFVGTSSLAQDEGPAGKYTGSRTDALHSITGGGGQYYKDAPSARRVDVTTKGVYYREDSSATPYVSTPTVTISQASPSAGTGASITATVNSTVGNANFGKVTGLTIANGGSNYLAWKYVNSKCCGDYYNGMSVVVKRPDNTYNEGPCVYEHRLCGVGNLLRKKGRVAVSYNGPTTPAVVSIQSEIPPSNDDEYSLICDQSLTATSNITNCSQWNAVEFTGASGATATVSAGGEYDAGFKAGECQICCKGNQDSPEEISVVLSGYSNSWNGTYVLVRQAATSNLGGLLYRTEGVTPNVSAAVELCSWSQFPAFFSTDITCDTCHRKCRTVVEVFTNVSDSRFTSSGAFLPIDCDACTDTPICAPEPGTYTNAGSAKQAVIE